MQSLDSILRILNRWEGLGAKITKNGDRLIGHIPHVGSMAYLNIVFGPLTKVQISEIVNIIGHALPNDLERFYLLANGGSFFDSIEIYGLRRDYDRSISDNVYQPISMDYLNVTDKVDGKLENMTFFGSYNWDGSKLFMLNEDQRVFMCSANSAAHILHEWPNFEQFLLSEMQRLSKLFDSNGKIKDEDSPTIPPTKIGSSG